MSPSQTRRDDAAVPDGDVSVLFEPTHTVVVLSGDVGVGLLDDLVDVAADIVRRGAPVVVSDPTLTAVDDVGAWFLALARTVPVRPGWRADDPARVGTGRGTPDDDGEDDGEDDDAPHRGADDRDDDDDTEGGRMTDPLGPAQPTAGDDGRVTPDVTQALVAVVDVCQAVVPGAVGVSVTLLRDREPYTLVTSTNLAARLDEIQYAEGRGPCLESLSTGRPVDAPDLAADDRWGSYPALAADAGVASVYAYPLPTEDLAWGAVNVYGAVPQAFTGEDRERIAVLAHQVAISLTLLLRQGELSERTRQLQQALTSRTVIDVAKGILVADHAIGPDAAFELLKGRSQQTNVRLRDVAAGLVESRSSAPGGGGSSAPGGGSAT